MLRRSLGQRSRWLAAVAATSLALGVTATTSVAGAQGAHTRHPLGVGDRPSADGVGAVSQRLGALPERGRYSFLLQLGTATTSDAFAAKRSFGRSVARQAAKAQLGRVQVAQNRAIGQLPSQSRVLYRSHVGVAGVAVSTDVRNFRALTRIPGVEHVYPIAPKTATNSYAVPLQSAPAAWEGSGALGQDTTIAVIDTGIDFTHANFGGPGTTDAYEAEHAHADEATLAATSIFPTEKVIGGYDLVGDSYNADPASDTYQPVPHPDPNPLDCEGHGSHVAGSAAGYGVNADGSTYSGTYDTSTDFGAMKIGPGMAPQARLIAFRVFGCDGSTDVTGAAIDRAMDPNGDGDPSDHVDVVNMSLGSDFGSPEDGDAIMSDAASELGITMAISSGNSYDLYDVGGSPGSSQRAITVAASLDAQSIVDGLNVDFDGSTAPGSPFAAERSVAYNWADQPDLAGTVVVPVDNATGCDPFDPADAALIAGKVALLRWTDDNLECGSVKRSGNVNAAGGIGFVFASNKEAFSAGITGSTVIPGVLVNHAGGQAIRDAIAADKVVTVTGTTANAVTQTFPADNDKLTDFSSRGIHGAGHLKPDVTAVGGTVFSTAVGTGSDGVNESGTSMAAPMVAGLAALVVSKHPDWTPEQVKADIMNTAGANLYTGDDHTGERYAPNRVGSGRIDAEAALNNRVLAYVTDDPGAVSASFGPVAVTGPLTMTKTIKVQNTTLDNRTYTTGYDEITSVPGVEYTVSPASVDLTPRGSAKVTVTLSIPDPTALAKTFDATHGNSANGLDLQTLADASGNVVLTPESGAMPALRVPVYSAPRPASSMTQASSLTFDRTDSTKTLALTGTGVDQGEGPQSIFSLASGFELVGTSPRLPACTTTDPNSGGCASTDHDKAADLKYVGVTSDAPYTAAGDQMAYFAITSQGEHGTAAGQAEFDIYLDTDGDGTPDLAAYNGRIPDQDTFMTILVDLKTGDAIDYNYTTILKGRYDTATFDSDTIVMPLWLPALADYGVDAAHPRVGYAISTLSYSRYGEIDSFGWNADGSKVTKTADLFTPGVSVVDSAAPADGRSAIFDDQPGSQLAVTRDVSSYAADGGQGILMVHFHNAGSRSQVVSVAQSKMASQVTLTAPSSARVKQSLKATVAVATQSGVVPTGKVTLTSGGKTLATGTLSGGKATLTFKADSRPGTMKVVASYAGDANYNAGTSATKSIVVKKAPRKHKR